MATLNFEDAVEALRRLHVDGDALSAVAQPTGCSPAEFAAGLLAFLRVVQQSVKVAARPVQRVWSIGAHGRLDEHYDLPPGYRLVPRRSS